GRGLVAQSSSARTMLWMGGASLILVSALAGGILLAKGARGPQGTGQVIVYGSEDASFNAKNETQERAAQSGAKSDAQGVPVQGATDGPGDTQERSGASPTELRSGNSGSGSLAREPSDKAPSRSSNGFQSPRSQPVSSKASAKKTAASQGSLSSKEQLRAALQSKNASFQACFAKDLHQAAEQPSVQLRFTVPAGGGQAAVDVEPATIARTALGGCLRSTARGIQFPALGRSTSFRIPVRAKISRRKGSP
ncbi:MAG: hypothetical protein MK135_14620, partial [Polyangiaceae bacterium]|nr:hypothetical protein [Polyangiaceae bacterium]